MTTTSFTSEKMRVIAFVCNNCIYIADWAATWYLCASGYLTRVSYSIFHSSHVFCELYHFFLILRYEWVYEKIILLQYVVWFDSRFTYKSNISIFFHFSTVFIFHSQTIFSLIQLYVLSCTFKSLVRHYLVSSKLQL